MPWPDTWLTAWRNVSEEGGCGVALSGTEESIRKLWQVIQANAARIQAELPSGSSVARGRFGIRITKPNAELRTDDEKRAWIKINLNAFVTVLKPHIEKALRRANS